MIEKRKINYCTWISIYEKYKNLCKYIYKVKNVTFPSLIDLQFLEVMISLTCYQTLRGQLISHYYLIWNKYFYCKWISLYDKHKNLCTVCKSEKCHFSVTDCCTNFGTDCFSYMLRIFSWRFNTTLEIYPRKGNWLL